MDAAYDLIIRNARIIDGTGGEPYDADVGVKGQKIAAIGDLANETAQRIIDARGLVLTPGFVDCHSHADLTIFQHDHSKTLSPLVRQGITTFIGGNCGMGVAPIGNNHRKPLKEYMEVFIDFNFDESIQWDTVGEYMEALEKRGMLLNAGLLVPHGLLRIHAMGLESRFANVDEIEEMKYRLHESLEAGALGLSTGLQYFPGSQSNTEELKELAKPLKKFGGLFVSHLRSYSNTLPRAIDEIVEITTAAGIPGQVSHIFWAPDMGKIGELSRPLIRYLAKLSKRYTVPLPLDSVIAKELKKLQKIEESGGPRVRMDVMPTTTGFTHMMAFFPPWALVGDTDIILERLRDPEMRRRMRHDIETGRQKWPHLGKDWSMNLFKIMGWECATIMSVASDKNKRYEGMNLCDIARERRLHPFEAACQLLLEENGRVLIFESMAEPDDKFTERSTFASMKHPLVAVSTDTILLGMGKPSDLFYSCYPKFVNRYVKQLKMLSLSLAVRKMTGLPAEHFGLKDRGLIKKGYFADLAVFDPDTFAPRGGFVNPNMDPMGVHYVAVNGTLVVDGGNFVLPEKLPGRVIRREVPA